MMPLWVRVTVRLTSVVALVSLASLAGLLVVRELVDASLLRAANEELGTFVQTVGTIYAVLLAFVVVIVWGQFNDSRGFVNREAQALVDLHRTASGLPASARDAIQRCLCEYVEAVVADEWQAMARYDQKTIEDVGRRLDRVWAAIHACRPEDDCQHAIYAEVLQRFNDLSQLRTSRLVSAGERIPISMNVLLYTGALIMVGSVYILPFAEFWLHATVTGALAGAVGHILFLIHDLDDAFAGDWQVEKAPFVRARRSFDRNAELFAARSPAPADAPAQAAG